MTALLEPTTEAPSPEQAPEPPAPVERPCATCGAALVDGQDWCLECGSAQPGRLGGRPGWRAAMAVVGVTVLLALGAGAAAYAALNSEAQRVASAPPPPAAAPVVEQPPAATAPGATPPAETPEVDPPASESNDLPKATSGDDDEPDAETPVPADDAPAAPADEDVPAEPVAIDLKADAASTYDPYKRAAAGPTTPARAIDGKPGTAWEAPVAEDGSVRVGLALSLEQATKLKELELQADTPGFTVELYATRAAELPPDVLDARWKHLRDKKDVGVRQSLKIDGEYRHVLVWITAQPADTKVAIPEIQLFEED